MREGLSEIRGKAKPRGGRRYYTWILSRRAFLCSNKPVKAISSRLTYENENALKAFLLRLRTEFHFRKEESLRSEEERKKGGVAHRGIREGAISLPSIMRLGVIHFHFLTLALARSLAWPFACSSQKYISHGFPILTSETLTFRSQTNAVKPLCIL